MKRRMPFWSRKRSHRELVALAEVHALDALDPDDRREVERHVSRGCDECESVVAEVREVAAALALAVAPVAPAPASRARLLAATASDAAVARRRFFGPGVLWPLATAASAAIALLALAQLSRLDGLLESERELRGGLERSLASLEAERRELDRRLARVRGRFDTIAARETRSVDLAGSGAAASASARAYIDPESLRVILAVHDLPPLPPGRSYQLWLIVGDAPHDAGVFDVDPAGRALHDLEAHAFSGGQLRGKLTVAVTIESEGGKPQPTGPIVLAGT